MQCIDRGVEIAVFLLQPCELGFEFALIFVGHGGRFLKNADEIAKACGSQAQNIVPASPVRKQVRATDAGSLGAAAASRTPAGGRTHGSLQMILKYEVAIFDIHRQIRGVV